MKSTFSVLFILNVFFLFAQDPSLETAFQQVNSKNYEEATATLKANLQKDPSDIESASFLIYLNDNILEKNDHKLYRKAIESCENPSPYLYAMWFNGNINIDDRTQGKEEIEFLENIIENEKVNETVKASARYRLINNYTVDYDFKKVQALSEEIGAITEWSFTGVFDNTSGSGFNKDYEAIHQPEASARFKNKNNAEVYWFKPQYRHFDPWTVFVNTLNRSQGVLFAQTFANNPTARDLILKMGGEGSMKVWVNDKLVIENEENLRTELDYFQRKIHLPAGVNRILVQIGFTNDNDSPNFLMRFADENDHVIKDITYSSEYKSYNKPESVEVKEEIPPFQEAYFKKMLEKNPKDRLSRILLAKCYRRANKGNKALELLAEGRDLYPDDFTLRIEELVSLTTVKDRTKLLEKIEDIRMFDEDLLFLAYFDLTTAKENKNFTKMEKLIEQMRMMKGKDETYYQNWIQLYSDKKDYQSLLPLIEEAYNKFPYNTTFLILKYNVERSINESGKPPLYLLEKYLKKRFNSRLLNYYLNQLKEFDNKKQAIKVLKKYNEYFPEETSYIDDIAGINYGMKNYYESYDWNAKNIGIDPFVAKYHINQGYISIALGKEDQAIKSFTRAIELNPNSFESREKLRELEGKEPLMDHFVNDDVDEVITQALDKKTDSNEPYEFILNELNYMYFKEGASTQFEKIAIKIHNKSGLETWTEASIPYNYYWEELTVYKAEVHKPNGQTIEGERNYNDLVFTGLEVGDVIYIEYRKDIYTGGKLAKEIFLEETVSSFANTYNKTIRVYLPKDKKVYIDAQNIAQEPKELEFEDFKGYEWQFKEIEKTKDENYMPNLSEIGKVIRIYTIKEWQEISNWYHDLAIPMAKEDYNLNQVYDELFEGKEDLSDIEKAKIIYRYIQDNIAYSSVSFRQSNYIPQKPMVTISTKLGDCKDVSTLYHTLANKAGLKTNLVLVSTRYNGENHLQFPTTNFNHCIVRIIADEDTLFQELTDNKLPFGVSPPSITRSQALVIPNKKENKEKSDLIHIENPKWILNGLERKVQIKLDGEELEIKSDLIAIGDKASSYRRSLSELSEDEMDDAVEEYVARYFDQDISIEGHEIENLEDIDSNIVFSTDFRVKNMLKKIGSIKTFTLPMFDEIVSLKNLSNEERKYPLEYWRYETVDLYQNEYEIELGEAYKIFETPKDFSMKNEYFEYELSFNKINDHKIEVKRVFKPFSKTIAPDKYKEFRELINQILKAEDIFISFQEK